MLKNLSKNLCKLTLASTLLMTVPSCAMLMGGPSSSDGLSQFKVPFEKYTLANGLDVILHVDSSDPIVSLAITYHVGSSREEVGRTGFAHLFEHMLFQRSENVPEDQFFKIVQNAGGTLNGFTTNDQTTYFEVAPKSALEKLLWLESDRMGYFINTVTEQSFNNQQEVVQNEKRQRVDNRPYGHLWYILAKQLFPENHPYNWQVIGEMKDLQSATLEDVKKFYANYYGPNNATLVLAGDFEPGQAKVLIEKYFGEIKKGKDVPMPPKARNTLSQTKKVFHEDNFAKLPRLALAWPSVENYHKDHYALQFLAQILSNKKKSVVYKELVKNKQLTSSLSSFPYALERAGNFNIQMTGNQNVNLTQVETEFFKALEKFEQNGVSDKDIKSIKAALETDFYGEFAEALNKAISLSMYNEFLNQPQYIEEEIRRIQAVSKEDVMRVYNQYIKNKPYVAVSMVPKGQSNLMVAGSKRANVAEEKITKAQKKQNTKVAESPIKKTPSKIDRSTPPAEGQPPKLNIPPVWSSQLTNGVKISGIERSEIPIVKFQMSLKGGLLLDSHSKVGVANLLTNILGQGTATKTPAELEDALNELGASLSFSAGRERIVMSGQTLARNFDATMSLVKEVLLQPRWDAKEFSVAQKKTLNGIKANESKPSAIASRVFRKLLYGKKNLYAMPINGTQESVNSIMLEDLKSYYQRNFTPSLAAFKVVGQVNQSQVENALRSLEKDWAGKDLKVPSMIPVPPPPTQPKLYFVDIPNSKQSHIYVGHLSMKYNDPDFYPSNVMNVRLGGNFSSQLNMILREEKGYTYGARSYFSSTEYPGFFLAASSVKSNTTPDSVRVFKETIGNYSTAYKASDLTFTKNTLIKSNARKFESFDSLIGMLDSIERYNLPTDYLKRREDIVQQMTVPNVISLAKKHIHPEQLVYLVVGDANTQLAPLKALGLGNPILLDRDGNQK